MILNFLFSSYYKIFLKTKDDTPIFATVCMIIFVFTAWLLFILILLEKYNIWDLFTPTLIYIYIAINFIAMYFLFRFYKKEKVANILYLFEKKSLFVRNIWILISLLMLILPLVSNAVLLTK